MKIFGVACFFLFALHAWAQNVIEIEFEKPIQATATQHKEIELHKPFGVPVNYTLRFKDFNRPNLNDKDTRQILQLIDNTGNPTENNFSKPFAAYNYNTDSLNTKEGEHFLEVNIFIPNDYFRFDSETFNLSFSHYGGVNYSNLIAKATVSVQISCEHPEYYSITQWNKGIPENLEVVKAIQKEDHLLVYAHRPKDSVASTYKIRLRAHERFETTTSTQYSKATLGLINVPPQIEVWQRCTYHIFAGKFEQFRSSFWFVEPPEALVFCQWQLYTPILGHRYIYSTFTTTGALH